MVARKKTSPLPAPSASRRPRRSAEDARRQILDAAERQLEAGGPASIRLQDLARDVGVSHPTILHHFGSREGLLKAVVDRALDQLSRVVVAQLARSEDADAPRIIDMLFSTLGERGHARVMAWLLLSGETGGDPGYLEQAARVCHALRVQNRGDPRAPEPAYQDTVFVVLLAALAAFGDGVAGPAMRKSAGLPDDESTQKAFRVWLAERLVELFARDPA